MGIVFRQSIKSTIVIFGGAMLGAISNLIYPYILSKTELGLFTNIIYTAAMLQIFMMLGTGTTIAVYTQKYPVDDDRKKMLITFGCVTTFLVTVLFTFAYIAAKGFIIQQYQPGDRELIKAYFYWVPLLILFMSFTSLFESYLISQTKTAVSAFSKEVLLRLFNLALLALLFLHYISFQTFIILSILVYIVPLLVLYFVSSKTKGFGYSLNINAFTRSEYKDLLKFAWYHLLLTVTLNVLGYIDTIMLGALDKNGIQTVAPYRTAVFIIAIMIIPYRAMSVSSHATLNQAFIDKDMPRLKDLFARAGINILVVAVGMFILIACNLDNLIALFPAGYEVMKPIIMILMLGRLVDMMTGLNTELIALTEYYKFNFRISIVLLVLVIMLNRIFIPVYSIYGAAWSTTCALIIFNISKAIFLWKKMNLHPFTKGSLMVLLSGTIVAACVYFVPTLSLFKHDHHFINVASDAIIRSCIIMLLYSILLIAFKPSADLNHYIRSVRSNKRLF